MKLILAMLLIAAVVGAQMKSIDITEGMSCPEGESDGWGTDFSGSSHIIYGKTTHWYPSGQSWKCFDGKWKRDQEKEKRWEVEDKKRVAEKAKRMRKFRRGELLSADELDKITMHDLVSSGVPYFEKDLRAEFLDYMHAQLRARLLVEQLSKSKAVKSSPCELFKIVGELKRLGWEPEERKNRVATKT